MAASPWNQDRIRRQATAPEFASSEPQVAAECKADVAPGWPQLVVLQSSQE